MFSFEKYATGRKTNFLPKQSAPRRLLTYEACCAGKWICRAEKRNQGIGSAQCNRRLRSTLNCLVRASLHFPPRQQEGLTPLLLSSNDKTLRLTPRKEACSENPLGSAISLKTKQAQEDHLGRVLAQAHRLTGHGHTQATPRLSGAGRGICEQSAAGSHQKFAPTAP